MLADTLWIKEIETSPGGTVKSSGLNKIYSKQAFYLPECKWQIQMTNTNDQPISV